MSDNIPFEIQVEIIKKLPVKSLIRFRSVSKTWKSLIESSDFIAHYSGHHSQVQHLMVNYSNMKDFEQNYVSIVDDDTFPQHKVSPDLPLLVKMLKYCTMIGSSHGLLCFDACDTSMAVIWNVTIRKAVGVVVPNVGDGMYYSVLGFGVCGETNDPKIVKITSIRSDVESVSCIPWQVEVFTLSTGAWRSPYNNLPRKSIEFFGSQVVLNDFLYFLTMDRITTDGRFRHCNLIISFDMTSEEFREINLPDSLAWDQFDSNLYISKLRESVVLLERDESEVAFIVWMMEDGVSKSFTKLFTINMPDVKIFSVPEFRKSGEPIIQILGHCGELVKCSSLAVYEPYSKQINNLGIHGTDLSFSVYSYTETLLLLDQPNFIVYDNGE